tara:strand:+ start:460 stop:1026 length:567 start_codon:yes stop_codon:yes gene_type:complete
MTRSKIRTSGAEGLTLSSTSLTVANGLTMTDGNIAFANGHGLDFASASGDASGMAAEVFNDYEEGSFTPRFDGGSTTGSGTYSSVTGKYIRIGHMVHITIAFGMSGHTGSGTAHLRGLPFTVGGSAEFTGSVMLNNYNLSSNSTWVVLYANTGNDYLRLYGSEDNGNWAAQDLDTVSSIIGSFTYFIN